MAVVTVGKVVLAVLVLAVGVSLARRTRPLARLALFGSALVVSGLLFLPGGQIARLVGKAVVSEVRRLAAFTPWGPSDWTHFALFAWLGLLLWLGRADLRGWKAWALLLVLAVAAELLQVFAPERSVRADDALLNIAGGMAGLLLAMGIRACHTGIKLASDPTGRTGDNRHSFPVE